MIPLVGAAVARSSLATALPVYLRAIVGRAVTPAWVVSAQKSVYIRSPTSLSMVGSRRVRVDAIVSPDWCAACSVDLTPAATVLTTAPELSAPPRRGLWQPSQVRRSPGRTWIQL